MKEIFRKAIRFIGYLIGFGIILYPAVSDMVNQRNSTIAITNYDKTVQGITEEKQQRLIAEANAYNARMSGAAEVFDPFSEADQEKNKEYEIDDFMLMFDAYGKIISGNLAKERKSLN